MIHPRPPRLLILALAVLATGCSSKEDSLVNLGPAAPFRLHTVTSLDLPAQFTDPFPPAIGLGTPGAITHPAASLISPIPVFIVLAADGSPIALYARDPHLGCEVKWVEARYRFEDPCTGSWYNVAGEWEFGPSPRGLDRFAASINENDELIIDVGDFQLGRRHQ